MDFTYQAYENLISELRQNGYVLRDYHNWMNSDKCAILRHDIDFCPEKALEFAHIENRIKVRSTYFFLLSSDFYNIASSKNRQIIWEIKKLGHGIGLHFDEANYDETTKNRGITDLIEKEVNTMSGILDLEISAVSMHRPSKEILAADYTLRDAVNTYSKTFFEGFKYLSDSRHRWREPVLEIIKSNEHKRLQIVTHPFRYFKNGLSAAVVCRDFVNRANCERYAQMNDNIRDFSEIMREDEVK